MRNVLLLGLAISLSLLSCKDDDDTTQDPTPPMEIDNYTPLEIGNYWVYENVKIDEYGTEIPIAQTDSIYIERDTLINGNTYYVLEGQKYIFNSSYDIFDIIRDSVGYLVTHNGEIRFSSTNFSDILLTQETPTTNPVYFFEFKMEKILTTVNVPAGDFEEVYNYSGKIYDVESSTIADSTRTFGNYYVNGVGKIFETTFFLNGSGVFEKRLIRYNVE